MIVEIGTICINLLFEIDYNIHSVYFKRFIALYGGPHREPKECDFTFKVIECTQLPSQNYPMEYRNSAFYYETNDTFTFETDAWAGTICWANKVMTTMFFNPHYTGLEDRLLINSLRLLISLLVLQKGGLTFHCSALINEKNRGLIFSGLSSTGKTSIAKFLHQTKGWSILNDEFNIILPFNDTYYVFSTPFTAPEQFIFCLQDHAPIYNMYFLKKGIPIRIENMTMKEKYFSVLGGTFTYPTSQRFSKIIMTNVEKISRNLPMHMLYFNYKDRGDISKFFVGNITREGN